MIIRLHIYNQKKPSKNRFIDPNCQILFSCYFIFLCSTLYLCSTCTCLQSISLLPNNSPTIPGLLTCIFYKTTYILYQLDSWVYIRTRIVHSHLGPFTVCAVAIVIELKQCTLAVRYVCVWEGGFVVIIITSIYLSSSLASDTSRTATCMQVFLKVSLQTWDFLTITILDSKDVKFAWNKE